MPVYTYTARDQRGTVSRGSLEAESNQNAVAQLREQGLWVTDLRVGGTRARPEGSGGVPARDTSVAKRIVSGVSPLDASMFYRQLATLLHSGVGIFNALEMLSQPGQMPNNRLRQVVVALAQRALQGGTLSDVMERYPWLFDSLQVRLVQAGEAGGFLPDIFRRLADYLEREHELRQDIRKKTLYPKLVLFVFLLVLPIRIPLTLAGYLGDLTWELLWVVGLGVPLWFSARLFLTSQAGQHFADQVKLAIPVTGKLVRKLAVSRFARSLAALYGAGVPINTAARMAGETSGNYTLEQAIARIVPALEKGSSLAVCLEATHFFPPIFMGMVHTGETTGNLDTMLDKAAQIYEQEATHATTQLVVTLGVVVLIGMAILVAIKVIGFYTGMLGGIVSGAAGE